MTKFALVLATVALLWLAAEVHYKGCVDAAKAAYPGFLANPGLGNPEAAARVPVSHCSRSPF